jgi:hypothetical protein
MFNSHFAELSMQVVNLALLARTPFIIYSHHIPFSTCSMIRIHHSTMGGIRLHYVGSFDGEGQGIDFGDKRRR